MRSHLFHVAEAEPDHPVAAPRERGVMGHQHQGHRLCGKAGEHEVDDRFAGGLVEIAGGLVGDQDRRRRRQRSRQRHPLLLAARTARTG